MPMPTSDREVGAPITDFEIRSAEGGGTMLVGYAARFNSPSSPIGGRFVERIVPGAFDAVLGGDVIAAFNHDESRVLGRTGAGSLRLSADEQGLRYEVDLDLEDPDALMVQRKLLTRKITGSSFMFSVAEDGDVWERGQDGTITRTITKIGALYDVGPVTFPAYPASTAAMRSLGELDKTAAEELTALEDEARQADADARARSLALIGC